MKHIITRSGFPALSKTHNEFLTPFSSIFDKIVEQHFPEFKEDFDISFGKSSYPKVDVISHTDSVEIIAEVAGWKKEDINIEVDKSVLTLSGNNTESNKPAEKGTYIVKELKRSSFTRSFQLTDKMDEKNISAKFEDGILTITVPKKVAEPEKTKTFIKID